MKCEVRQGDCREAMAAMEAASVDAIVTDPPYGLEFMGKEWDRPWMSGMAEYGMSDSHGRKVGPVHGSKRNPVCLTCHKHLRGRDRCLCAQPEWDETAASNNRRLQEWHLRWTVEILRVAKPGAHLLAFGGTRTFHRLTCAIEDAGWEIRDCVMWLYGSGFPKSLDVSKAIDKAAGAQMETRGHFPFTAPDEGETPGAFRTNEERANPGCRKERPATQAAKQWQGWGTALKPAWEPIIVARKPLEGTVAQNVQKYGTGAINVDGCRIGTQLITTQGGDKFPRLYGEFATCPESHHSGRWPANVIHDGSEQVMRLFPNRSSGQLLTHHHRRGIGLLGTDTFRIRDRTGEPCNWGGDTGSAARFFYQAKADSGEREDGLLGQLPCLTCGRLDSLTHQGPDGGEIRCRRNNHPTVKPVALMRYLVRLVTPPDGLVLDPFAGSGTTGLACMREGFDFIGVELDAGYCEIARRRIAAEREKQPLWEDEE